MTSPTRPYTERKAEVDSFVKAMASLDVDYEAGYVASALATARDLLRQYHEYSEMMRAFGRGFTPSCDCSPEYFDNVLVRAITLAKIA
jgi:hypothetical protein